MIDGDGGPDLDGVAGGCRSRDHCSLGGERVQPTTRGGRNASQSRQLINGAALVGGPVLLGPPGGKLGLRRDHLENA